VTDAAELKHSPLDAVHRRLGAKMGAFAGWDMPIEYAGTLSEHKAVREAVGLFDLSHLGKVEVSGPGAEAALQHALTNDLGRLAEVGAAQYTMCLLPDGGIVDDLIVYREAGGWLMVPNAANWPAVADKVRESAAELGVEAEVTGRPDLAVIAVQGPNAPELVGGLFPAAAGLDYMHVVPVEYGGQAGRLARTGYTGERGFELIVPGDVAAGLWDELTSRGAGLGVVPVGLGARDTLRLEMGYALHGNDISPATDPLSAKLGWAVALGKEGGFRGRDAVAAIKEAGPARVLAGLESADRLIPRHGMRVLDGETEVGEVTSGTFSPTLRHGVALAYVDAGLAKAGTELVVDVRGRRGSVTVTRPPFVEASPK
jgi:aminomethyltransferase